MHQCDAVSSQWHPFCCLVTIDTLLLTLDGIAHCTSQCVQASIKVWRYGNQQVHLPHMDTDYKSVVATVIVYLSDSGKTAYSHANTHPCHGRRTKQRRVVSWSQHI